MQFSLKKKKQYEDQELLQQYLKTNNLDILGELYNRYIYLVYGVCLKYFSNKEESKDAVTRIFELLITEIPKYNIENFRSWLYVVSKNHCLMEIRKQKAERKHIEKYSEHFFMENTELLHPIDEVPGTELEERLKECIEKLKSEQKQCINLFYYEKQCYKEIANELKLEQTSVKSFIQNAKRNLKICMEPFIVANEI